MLRIRSRRAVGVIESCLPSPANQPPARPDRLREIEHDGIRMSARRDGTGVRLITRHDNDISEKARIIAYRLGSQTDMTIGT